MAMRDAPCTLSLFMFGDSELTDFISFTDIYLSFPLKEVCVQTHGQSR